MSAGIAAALADHGPALSPSGFKPYPRGRDFNSMWANRDEITQSLTPKPRLPVYIKDYS
jgi:hypothetical protein